MIVSFKKFKETYKKQNFFEDKLSSSEKFLKIQYKMYCFSPEDYFKSFHDLKLEKKFKKNLEL